MKKFYWTLLLCAFLSGIARGQQCDLPKPENLNVVSVTSCEVQISWSPVANVSYYQVRYKHGNDPWSVANVGTDTSWTLSNLTPFTTWSFRVATFCDNQQTWGYSPPVIATLPACTQPQDVEVQNVTAHEATISWSPVCNSS